MRGRLYLAGLILALLAGLISCELLWRSAAFRDLAGRLAGRGHLIALANGKGIYETDFDGDGEATVSDFIVAENLRRTAQRELVDPARIEREFALLKAQFANEKAFEHALRANGLSVSSLRKTIAIHLRGLQWLEKNIAPASRVTEQECRQFYDTHRDFFTQPLRFRASHIFLAAHEETPPEVVEKKELAIATLAERLAKGESFSQLAGEASEDEATKADAGDLGFFAESRMPPEFMAEIQKLRLGEVSKPFRTHLGFHIAQVTDIKPARLLTFEEVALEISLAMANERRAIQADRLVRNFNKSDYLRLGVD